MTVDTQPTPGNGQGARVAVNVGVPLQGLDEAYRLSQNLALANLLPQALRGKPADVLATILYGQELGLAPMQAIQGIYVVNGRPTLAAQTWLALARRAGHRITVVEHTDTSCTVEVTRGDTKEQHRETFSIADAQRAKLADKDVWKQHPRRMTLARAVSNCCRFICPEIALGFYAEGEVDDQAPSPTLAQVAAQRTSADATDEADVEDAEIVDELRAELADIEAAHAEHVSETYGVADEAPAADVPVTDWPPAAQPGSGARKGARA